MIKKLSFWQRVKRFFGEDLVNIQIDFGSTTEHRSVRSQRHSTKFVQISFDSVLAAILSDLDQGPEHVDTYGVCILPTRRHELSKSEAWNKLSFEERMMFFKGAVVIQGIQTEEDLHAISLNFSEKSCEKMHFYRNNESEIEILDNFIEEWDETNTD